jgi:hypothetical protein
VWAGPGSPREFEQARRQPGPGTGVSVASPPRERWETRRERWDTRGEHWETRGPWGVLNLTSHRKGGGRFGVSAVAGVSTGSKVISPGRFPFELPPARSNLQRRIKFEHRRCNQQDGEAYLEAGSGSGTDSATSAARHKMRTRGTHYFKCCQVVEISRRK